MSSPASETPAADAARERLSHLPIGDRVTVRFLVDDGALATDAVGELVRRDDASVTVATRRRGEVLVPLVDVVAARRVD